MRDKPTVLIVHSRYRQRGGEDTAAENEIRLLMMHGHRVLLYERENPGVFFPHSLYFNIKVFLDIRKIIKKERVDIVHVHNTWMAVSRSVYYAALGMGVPVVQTLHNFRLICPAAILYRDGAVCEDCIRYGLKAGVRRRCYRGSFAYTLACALDSAVHQRTGILRKVHFICLSEFNKQKMLRINDKGAKRIDPGKVYVKPNFIWERPEETVITDGKLRDGFIFAGRLTEEKGVRILLKAWELLGDEAPQLRIYGKGDLAGWCRKEIDGKHLNATLMGEADHHALLEAMGRAEAFIFPSVWYEGFPMTVIESLSLGTPVIAGGSGNGIQLIEEGSNGLLYKPGSAKALARAVKLVRDKDMVFDHKPAIPGVCTPEGNYGILEDIYKKVLSNTI